MKGDVPLGPDQFVAPLDHTPRRDPDGGHPPALNPGRLFRDEGVADVPVDASVGAARQKPRPRRLGGLEKAFAKAPLDARLQFKVGLAAGHCDEEFGLGQAPARGVEQKVEHQFGPGVVGQPQVLGLVGVRSPIITMQSEFIRYGNCDGGPL